MSEPVTRPEPGTRPHVAVVGAGFTGLAAAYELLKLNMRVSVFEADDSAGGLAGSFPTAREPLEKFYHHWFRSDTDAISLAAELGAQDRLVFRNSATGTWYANSLFWLSSPLDLLRFRALSPTGRIRLAWIALHVRRTNAAELGDVRARDWLIEEAGEEVFRVVWEPLLQAKFGAAADRISAAWMVSKLQLRGGSRKNGGRGAEQLGYFRGGFAAFVRRLSEEVLSLGGSLNFSTPVTGLDFSGGGACGVQLDSRTMGCDAVLATTAPALVAPWIRKQSPALADQCDAIEYLANVCVVLILDRSLGSTYWLNVNDPTFPFVAVIEHTNFEPASSYAGQHVAYLSRYMPVTDPVYGMTETGLLHAWLPHLRRNFPAFRDGWVLESHTWRARYAQPVVVVGYERLLPPVETDIRGLYLASMAQVYPEDRGTNYAIRSGRAAARRIAADLEQQ
jgi:protoporphyrinogen oxidase